MIPTRQAWSAQLKRTLDTGATYFEKCSVEAWSDEGEAMIVDERTGYLRGVRSYPNFVGLAPDSGPVVAAVPGGGWWLAWPQEDGTEFLDSVLAWTVNSDGLWSAHSSDSEGVVEEITFSQKDRPRFIAPTAGRPEDAA